MTGIFRARAEQIQSWLFPPVEIYARRPSIAVQLLGAAAATAVFAGLGSLIPQEGLFAFDWRLFQGEWEAQAFHPPWTGIILLSLTWPLFAGLSMTGVLLAVWKRAAHPISAAASLLTLPLFWTLFLGQMDGLMTLGLLGLPWLAPLALMKPQVTVFAFAARRSWLLALAGFLLLSFLLWGFWPADMIQALAFYEEGNYEQDIALRGWGIPLALVLIWFSRGDMDMLMGAGCFATLHLIPYNLLPLTPAISRLRPGPALAACVFSWLPLLSNWTGPAGWWLGWVFILWLWGALAWQRAGPASSVREKLTNLWMQAVDPPVSSRSAIS